MSFLSFILLPLLAGSIFFRGLPSESAGMNVATICQDQMGNMWFGGRDGVTRYDGVRYTAFQHISDDVNSIPDNHIYKIICCGSGSILAAHLSGLSVLDPSTDTFQNHPSPGGAVTDIVQLTEHRFLVVAGSKLWLFDSETGKFSNVMIPASVRALDVNLLEIVGDNIYIGTTGGRIVTISREMDHISEIPLPFDNCKLNCILLESPSHIWIGTEGKGLWKVSLSGEGFTRFVSSPREGSISSDNVRALALDSEGVLWVGTKNGLNVFRDNTRFEVFHHEYYVPRSLSHNSICSIFRDRQGVMWIGTYFGGVCYCNPGSSRFVSLFSRPGDGTLNGNVISDIVETPDGSLWIGTNTGDLNHLYPDGRIVHVKGHGEQEPLDMKSIFYSPYSGRIFVGSDRGLLAVVSPDGRSIKPLANGLSDVYAMEDNGNGRFFLGTPGGLYEYDESLDLFSEIVVPGGVSGIKSMKRTRDGILWIGMKFGAVALRLNEGESIPLPDELSRIMYVECFCEDASGRVWIGSHSGLFCYDVSTGGLKSYNARNGLPDNIIHGLESDTSGRIWVSTNRGLCRLDPSNDEIVVFTEADGLPENRFTSFAHCLTRSGTMYFGGLSWLVCFNPEDINPSKETVLPVISGLEVNGALRRADGKNDARLNIGERDVSFLFSAPDYVSGKDGNFLYMMSGIDDRWHRSGTARRAVYRRLQPGKYTFYLKYSNSAGIGSDEILEFHLTVPAYWYETIIFKLFCATALLFLIVIFFLRLISRKNKAHQSELEKVRNDLMNEFSLEFLQVGQGVNSRKDNGDKKIFVKSDEAFMRKALQVVKKNMENPDFSVEQFASEMYMSRSSLHLRVKALFRVSSLEFIKTVRLNEACRLLLEKNCPVSEVAYRVGFATPSYFTAVFRRTLNCTPSEYVRNHSAAK